MARGEKKGNREAKKPKQPKAQKAEPASTFANVVAARNQAKPTAKAGKK
jgi:hypothetical protein